MINVLNYSEKNVNNISSNNQFKKYLDIKSKIENTKIPKFLIDGNYLKNKGMKEGKSIGNTLKILEKEWIENNFNISEQKISMIISNQMN